MCVVKGGRGGYVCASKSYTGTLSALMSWHVRNAPTSLLRILLYTRLQSVRE